MQRAPAAQPAVSDKTVRFAVVASAVPTRQRVRISLVRLPDLPPATFTFGT